MQKNRVLIFAVYRSKTETPLSNIIVSEKQGQVYYVPKNSKVLFYQLGDKKNRSVTAVKSNVT